MLEYVYTKFLPATLAAGVFKIRKPEPETAGHGLIYAKEALDMDAAMFHMLKIHSPLGKVGVELP